MNKAAAVVAAAVTAGVTLFLCTTTIKPNNKNTLSMAMIDLMFR